MALAALLTVPVARPAEARADTRSKAVLFVHGYSMWSNSDCGTDFDSMIARFRNQGFTGPLIKVGYYSADTNCDVNLHGWGDYKDDASWKAMAKAFSRYVYTTFTARGVDVDVVGYSMGGLITRGAIWGAQKGDSGFAPPLDVEDVVTLGTPHTGAGWFTAFCWWGPCTGLKAGSDELNWLNQNGNPQGRSGTEFTAIGSDGDWTVPTASAISMTIPATNKVVYANVPHDGATNYLHDTRVIARTGDALVFGSQ